MHGDKSTGPRTAEGASGVGLRRGTPGFYSKAAVADRKRLRALIGECVKLLKALWARLAA